MKRAVYALVVLSLIAALLASCSPDVGTGDSGNDNPPR